MDTAQLLSELELQGQTLKLANGATITVEHVEKFDHQLGRAAITVIGGLQFYVTKDGSILDSAGNIVGQTRRLAIAE
jgi:hypothetical protein